MPYLFLVVWYVDLLSWVCMTAYGNIHTALSEHAGDTTILKYKALVCGTEQQCFIESPHPSSTRQISRILRMLLQLKQCL